MQPYKDSDKTLVGIGELEYIKLQSSKKKKKVAENKASGLSFHSLPLSLLFFFPITDSFCSLPNLTFSLLHLNYIAVWFYQECLHTIVLFEKKEKEN